MTLCIHCDEPLDPDVHGLTTLHDYCRKPRRNLLQMARKSIDYPETLRRQRIYQTTYRAKKKAMSG